MVQSSVFAQKNVAKNPIVHADVPDLSHDSCW